MSGLVDSDDIRRWADTADAEFLLPQLVRRLVMATAGARLHGIRFPSGKGVRLAEWDGVTTAEGAGLFVPDGVAVWELSTDANPGAKAQEDYEKRTADPLGMEPGNVTYITVTARQWAGAQSWRQAREREGKWKRVEALDAQSLNSWLEAAPAVHYWFSSLLKMLPIGVLDIESWWREWSMSSAPPLSSRVVLAGRHQEAEGLRLRLLSGEPDVLAIRAESRDEALAFVAASLRDGNAGDTSSGQELGEVPLSRALVVEDLGSFRDLARSGSPLILIPTFEDRSLAGTAVQSGHIVVLPLSPGDRAGEPFLDLGPLTVQHVQAALRQLPIPSARAAELAARSGGSLVALRRLLEDPSLQGTEWARPDPGRQLAPLMLVQSWDEGKPADCEAVAAIAGRDYEDVHDVLGRVRYLSESPFTKVGTDWRLRSPLDAWQLLHRYLAEVNLKAFVDQTTAVLRLSDPRYELPADRRWAAPAYGKELPHSEQLRRGLAEATAMLGALSDESTLDSISPGQAWACGIVRGILSDAPWQAWASLGNLLPLLAEACPDEFLAAVQQGSKGDKELANLFKEEGAGLFGGAPHVGLVLGLEHLAWSSDYVSQAAVCLARLAEFDPGGNTFPRPRRSLVGILSPVTRPPAISHEMAINVVDLLRQKVPTVAWETMYDMVSRRTGPLSSLSQPEWRRWSRTVESSGS